MGIDLMSVDRSSLQALGGKPRPANDSEVSAYMRWQRERRGLPDLEGIELEWRTYPGSRGQRLCIGATFGKIAQERREITRPRWEGETYFPGEYQPELWENGAYSLVMPGHNAHKQTVTFESLEDAGNVERAQTLPMEPKKGGVIWSRDDVRKAHGPVAKPDKVKRGKVETDPIPVHAEAPSADPVEFSAPAAAESEDAPIVAQEGGEAPDALSGPEIAPEEVEADSVADLAERVAALEARLEALAVEAGAEVDPIPVARGRRPVYGERIIITQPGYEGVSATVICKSEVNRNAQRGHLIALTDNSRHLELGLEGENWIAATPSGEAARPARTAAHERAIRRAWAERKARRGAQGGMAIHARRIEALELQLRLAQNEQALDKQAVEEAYARAEQFARRGNQHAARRRASAQRARRMLAESRAQAAHYYANWKEEARREASHGRKRADSATRARRLLATSRKAAAFQRQRADVLAAQLDKLRADMADPIQPERASDIARLVRERDEARNAAAATSARNAALQRALNSLGDKLEAMAVRVTLAERAARVAPPIAV